MPTKKQKRRQRIRQKIADRQPTKLEQIRELMDKRAQLPINPLTGQVIYTPEDLA